MGYCPKCDIHMCPVSVSPCIEKEEEGLVCQCDPCRSKKARLEREKPNEAYKRFAK